MLPWSFTPPGSKIYKQSHCLTIKPLWTSQVLSKRQVHYDQIVLSPLKSQFHSSLCYCFFMVLIHKSFNCKDANMTPRYLFLCFHCSRFFLWFHRNLPKMWRSCSELKAARCLGRGKTRRLCGRWTSCAAFHAWISDRTWELKRVLALAQWV